MIGRRLARTLDRPFAHLRLDVAPSGPPELTIDLWEEAETGIGCEGCEPVDDLKVLPAIHHSADGLRISYRRPQIWTAFDRKSRHLVGWIHDSRHFTQYQLGRPLHSELLLWHSDRDVLAVHAGLVARDGSGVLLPGPGGSGKSTTALACLEAGFRYLGDDCVGVEESGDGRITGHSFFGCTALAHDHIGRFPLLAFRGIPGRVDWEDKLLVFLHDIWPDRLAASTGVTALALPRVTGSARTTIRPASSAEALLCLTRSSLHLLPRSRLSEGLSRLKRLVDSVPTYRLELGHDLSEIPVRLDELLGS